METDIKWKAPEYLFYPKTASWFYWSIFITLAILAFSIWQSNFLFGFFVVVAEMLILSWANRKPEIIDFALDQKGLTIRGVKPYPYTELKSFGLTELEPKESDFVEIILYFKRRLRTAMIILVPKEKSSEIQAALVKKIPKVDADLTIFDALERIIRF